MTDSEILTQFEGLIDDTLDQTLEIQLANNAKNRLERELKLLIHQKGRETNTTTPGQTYTTGVTLSTDFSMWVPLYKGTQLLRPVPFKFRVAHRSSSPDRFYTDHRAGTFHLTGTQGTAATLVETYIYKTTDITAASVTAGTTTLTWPDFHSLISYEMAKMFFAIDAGDKARAWDDRWEAHYSLLRKAMVDWDADLKLQELDGSTSFAEGFDSENSINSI